MVSSEMLKYEYQPKSGLGPKSNGIVEPIQLKQQTLIPDQAGVDDIVEGIGNFFVAMAGEEEEINLSKLIIRDAETRKSYKTGPSARPYFSQSPSSVEK
ncbi:hypothetical protein H5410_040990 [Solanum commersonii]|uniref:G-patch domain-containing protein n=1 Tax=Solanum commersonii TaxID=4109 RepID=A0A9J5XT60_SOLCO|nr:hypothetical protein H5410_040990 [Solanum commersonii]